MGVVITEDVRQTVVVKQDGNLVQINRGVRTVQVTTAGPRGPQGIPGVSGDGSYPAVEFAYGDASGVIISLVSNCEIMLVSLQIEEAFNGAGASIVVGTSGEPDLLMPADYNDPGAIGTYDVTPREELPVNTQIYLTITPGTGATQGRGQLVLQAVPTT